MNLESINWFQNVGKPVNSVFDIVVKLVDQKNCDKNINSTKWENFILYAINRLSWYIQSFHKEEAKEWNTVVRGFKATYDEAKAYVASKVLEYGVSNDVLVDVKGIVSMFLLEEYYVKKFGDQIPLQFKMLMDVYVAGHIPCGWDGPLPKNEGYEPIDFSKGAILIW